MIPRLSCVYCGKRIPCAFKMPRRIACTAHAALVKLDPRYTP